MFRGNWRLWIGYDGLIEMLGLLAHLEALVNNKITNPSLIRFITQHAAALSRVAITFERASLLFLEFANLLCVLL
jgi:hypothetical protein